MIKKIMIALLMLTSLFVSTSIIYARPITEVESESVSLIEKGLVDFSNDNFSMSNYMSVGYVRLEMGYSTIYDIDLSNVIQYFEHFSINNVSNVYIDFDLEAVYTGYQLNQYQWLSSNSNFDSTNKRLSLGSTLPTTTSAEIWWNVMGQSGGAPSMTSGSLRIRSIILTVEYDNSISLFTSIQEWDELPQGNNLMESYLNYPELASGEQMYVAELADAGEGKHDVYLDLEDDGMFVAENILLPLEIRNEPLVLVRYFATADYKYLWFFTKFDYQNIYESDFLLWNLTTQEYEQIVTGTIHGMPYAKGNGLTTYNMLYVDLAIPWKIDEIVSIRMQYQYRYHYLTGQYGKYYEEQKTLYRDATTTTAFPWWTKMLSLLAAGVENVSDIVGWLDYNQIENVTSSYDINKKQQLVSFLNANTEVGVNEYTVEEIFPVGSTVAKIYLGQYDKFGSDGVEAKDIVIMNIRYEVNGISYSKPFPDTVIPDQPVTHPGDPTITEDPFDKFLDGLWAFLAQVYLIFIGIIAYGLMRLASIVLPKKYKYNVFVRVGLTAVFFLILYFSYRP